MGTLSQAIPYPIWWIFVASTLAFGIVAFVLVWSFGAFHRRRVEQERRHFHDVAVREERYRSILENTIAGLLRISLNDGSAIEANQAALSMLGAARTEDLKILLPRIFGEAYKPLMNEMRKVGRVSQREVQIRTNGAALRWCLISGRRNEEEHSADLLLVDISEQKQLNEIMLLSQRLESVGTLASGIAHDLNNIMTPMMLSAELMERTAHDPEAREAAESLSQNIVRASDLIHQVLLFARGTPMKTSAVNLRREVFALISIMKKTFPTVIEFNADVPDSTWVVAADATQLQQVLMNICLNARDAMELGGSLIIRTINVAAGNSLLPPPLAQNQPYVLIDIADTGKGIPPENLVRVFEPFFTTKERGRGTGLGLSLSFGIVRRHGGTITVDSMVEGGTTFHVWLPVGTPPTEAPDAPAPISRLRASGLRVLLMEDDQQIVRVITRILEERACKVTAAANGAIGLRLFRSLHNQLDLIITDVIMPKVGGAEVVRTIRKSAKAFPILVISGLDLPAELQQPSAPRVNAFLSKPFTQARLLDAVDAAITDASLQPTAKKGRSRRSTNQ